MNAQEVYDNLDLNFTSSNNIPVTRSSITIEEYQIMKKERENLIHQVSVLMVSY